MKLLEFPWFENIIESLCKTVAWALEIRILKCSDISKSIVEDLRKSSSSELSTAPDLLPGVEKAARRSFSGLFRFANRPADQK